MQSGGLRRLERLCLVQRGRQPAAMLARKRVISAELGEDRDHHPAQQILALGILLCGQGALEPLERLLGVAASQAEKAG